MVYRVHLQHLQLHRLSFFHGVARILDVGDAELRHRHEALDVVPLVHDMSEMWIRPSMPGSISTNAPNEVRLRTLPLSRVPTGYFCGSAIQGSSSVCFMPRETFSSVSSTFSTTASIVSPIDTIFDG